MPRVPHKKGGGDAPARSSQLNLNYFFLRSTSPVSVTTLAASIWAVATAFTRRFACLSLLERLSPMVVDLLTVDGTDTTSAPVFSVRLNRPIIWQIFDRGAKIRHHHTKQASEALHSVVFCLRHIVNCFT